MTIALDDRRYEMVTPAENEPGGVPVPVVFANMSGERCSTNPPSTVDVNVDRFHAHKSPSPVFFRSNGANKLFVARHIRRLQCIQLYCGLLHIIAT